ncbi:oligosaccharide flippase family protein [Vibrio fluvialis]|nr:oligosaccharide flippase family protein [Vibrio fluvialis]
MENINGSSQISKYLKTVPWYLIGSIATKLIGMMLIPIYSHFLDEGEYGILSTVESAAKFLPILFSLYLDSAFIRYYYEERNEPDGQLKKVFSSHFWFLMIWGSFCCAIIIFYYMLSENHYGFITFSILIIILVPQLLNQLLIMVSSMWIAELKARDLAIFQFFFSILSVILTFLFFNFLDFSWEGRFLAIALVSLIQFTILIRYSFKRKLLDFYLNVKIIKRSLKFSLPLIPNTLSAWISTFSDRIILAKLGHINSVASYSIAAQLTLSIYIVSDAITKVQGAISMAELTENKNEAVKRIRQFLPIYLNIVGTSCFTLVLYSNQIVEVITLGNYGNLAFIVALLCPIYILSGIYRVFSNIILFHKKGIFITISSIIQAVFNVILNFSLIPYFGIIGAGISTLISMFAYTLSIVVFSCRMEKMDIDWFKVLFHFSFYMIGIIFASVYSQYLLLDLYKSILINSFILLAFLSLVYNFIFGEREKIVFKKALRIKK